jgi:murein DD-endopeptidase MepM/ murein hydrolase activator NlpD
MPLSPLGALGRLGSGVNALETLGGSPVPGRAGMGGDPLSRLLSTAPGLSAASTARLMQQLPALPGPAPPGGGARQVRGARAYGGVGTPRALAGSGEGFRTLRAAPGSAPLSGVTGALGGIRTLGEVGFGQPDEAGRLPQFGHQIAEDPKVLAEEAAAAAAAGGIGGAPGGGGPPVGTAGGVYGAVDAHNAEVQRAADQYGVPGNLLKAMLIRESSGNWEANNTNRCDIRPGKCMLPFVGVFDEAAASVGFDYQQMIGNKQLQINAMAAILARDYGNYGSWEAAASNYLTGNPYAYQTGQSDPEGTISATTYVGKLMADWKAMDALGGSYGAAPGATRIGGSAPSGGGWSSALWGNVPAQVSYEFNAPTVNGDMYLYGGAHGTNGWTHPGVDVSLPRGTRLYTPKAGVVSCVGAASANTGGTGGGSCGYFSDEGGGVGNVTIRFDDGTYLIFGHSSAALLQPGQRVSAGQAVALSGGLKGDHVHFEYRVPGNCSSGYCVADPRTLGGGTFAPQYGAAGPQGAGAAASTGPTSVYGTGPGSLYYAVLQQMGGA